MRRCRAVPAVPSCPGAQRSTAPACRRCAVPRTAARCRCGCGRCWGGRGRSPRFADVHIFAGDAAEIVPRLAHRALNPCLVLSGNAARRLARPMRCAGRSGPSRRATAPQMSEARSGSVRLSSQNSHLTTRPMIRSPYSARCRRMGSEFDSSLPNTSRLSSRAIPASGSPRSVQTVSITGARRRLSAPATAAMQPTAASRRSR